MGQVDLHKKILIYDEKRKYRKKAFQEMKNKTEKFKEDFSIQSIEGLSLEEYAMGTDKSGDSFCYRLEIGLSSLGLMKGSNCKKFGVYFGKWGKDDEKKYRFVQRFSQDLEEAFKSVKSEIVKLLIAGENRERLAINESKLAQIFSYKLLGSYYYDRYLNLYSDKHLRYFITELELNDLGITRIFDQEQLLLDFKQRNEITKNWSCLEFNNFLYDQLGYPPKDINKTKREVFSNLNQITTEIIELEILPSASIKGNDATSARNKKPNYIEISRRNSDLGWRGELIFLGYEMKILRKNKLSLDRIVHCAKDDDTLGYDIKTVDEEGNEKYIEVKSTRSQPGEFAVFISANELEKARNLPNYYIYVVFEAHTVSPKIWMVKDPINQYEDKMNIIPVQYRMDINVKN